MFNMKKCMLQAICKQIKRFCVSKFEKKFENPSKNAGAVPSNSQNSSVGKIILIFVEIQNFDQILAINLTLFFSL
jgi:hypothetical protein